MFDTKLIRNTYRTIGTARLGFENLSGLSDLADEDIVHLKRVYKLWSCYEKKTCDW